MPMEMPMIQLSPLCPAALDKEVIIAVDVLWALRVCSVVPADGCVLVLVQRPEHGDVS